MRVGVYIIASKYKEGTFKDKVKKSCHQCIGSQNRHNPKAEFCALHGCKLDEVVLKIPLENPPQLSNFLVSEDDGVVEFIQKNKNDEYPLDFCCWGERDTYDITSLLSEGLDSFLKPFIEKYHDDVKVINETYQNVEFRVGLFNDYD